MTSLLTIPSAAALLAISPATLRRWCSTGRVAHRKVGGAIRFTEEDVEAIVRQSYRGVRESEDAVMVPALKWLPPLDQLRARR